MLEKIENEQMEFKREYTDNILKEIVGFLNSHSGTIVIGVEDDGTVVGVENAKQIEESLSNKIRSEVISPDPSLFVSINQENINNKTCVVVKVSKGVSVYFLSSKGALNGVYTRTGSCTISATQELVQQLLIKSMNLSFEESVSAEQTLTFDYATNIFKQENIDIQDETIQKNLHFRDEKGNFTNLARLFSEQNAFPIRVGVYKDESKRDFIDIKEFGGSIFEVYDKTLEFLKLNSSKYGVISGSVREDSDEYPEFILREVLLNALIHRNYEIVNANIINIFQNDKMEFISLGGLYGITLEDALKGLSVSRNPLLQAIFMRLKRVESIGSGLRRIQGFYKDIDSQIDIEALPSSFIVNIPRIPSSQELSPKQLIINYIKKNGIVARKDLEVVIKKERTTLQNILKELIQDGILETEGVGRATKYKIRNK